MVRLMGLDVSLFAFHVEVFECGVGVVWVWCG